jgi:hypothetical protein
MVNEQYSQKETDPNQWLEKAEGLIISAEVLWNTATPLWPSLFDQNTNVKATVKRLDAYLSSCFLLTAYAFENLCRGIIVGRGSPWREVLAQDGGHSLLKQLSEVTDLTSEEKRLVDRLQTFLLWAGRYVVPKKVPQFVRDVRELRQSFLTSDWDTVTGLFNRLARQLRDSDTRKTRTILSRL